jgi:uncharacterized protein YkwD
MRSRSQKPTLAICAAALAVLLVAASLFGAPPRPTTTRLPEGAAQKATVALAYPPELATLSDPDCPDATTCPVMSPLQIEALALVNADRLDPANRAETSGRARPLMWDPRLAEAALTHSQDMARNDYFSHYDRAGNSPAERLSREGILWRAMGENIATNYTVALAEEAFMNEPRFEPNHRANVLNPRFNFVGIGIVRGPGGLYYVTEEFAQER